MRTQQILDRLAYHLRAARGGSGVKDKEAAAALGKHPSTVARWMASVSTLTVARYLDLCGVYEVDPGKLFERSLAEARKEFSEGRRVSAVLAEHGRD